MENIQELRLAELRGIMAEHGGLLKPADVVEYAKRPETALHSAFEWHDSVAAQLYRLEQARRIIRVCVEIVSTQDDPIVVQPAFTALKDERYEGGGYRSTVKLMNSQQGRGQVLQTALWELDAFQRKYAQLEELAEVFESIRRVRKCKSPA